MIKLSQFNTTDSDALGFFLGYLNLYIKIKSTDYIDIYLHS